MQADYINHPPQIIYIIGVSSCGKSTIGKLLSEKIQLPFFDADDFHSIENIEKMKSGHPLNDNDRQPWLKTMNNLANTQIKNTGAIIACSGLKKHYRQTLRKGIKQDCTFIYLKGDLAAIKNRMKQRAAHFMPIALLQAQFDDLEEPSSAISIDISLSPEEIIEVICTQLNRH
jgi:carbohydrate kinase (thermoresistant glucokinase family)